MRWQALFDDLEAQAAALDRAERSGEVDERTRAATAELSLYDRARAALGTAVRLRTAGGGAAAGQLVRAGAEWLLIDEGGGREAVIALAHVTGVRGFGRYSAVPGSAGLVESRLGLRSVLRAIARDRSPTRLLLSDGSVLDATIDRVGADFVEAAAHPAAEPRRRRSVRDVELIALGAIALVRRSV